MRQTGAQILQTVESLLIAITLQATAFRHSFHRYPFCGLWGMIIYGHKIGKYFKYAVAAAFMYSTAVAIYLSKASFALSWILFVGNFVFGILIALFVFAFYRNNQKTRSISKMAIAAHLTSIMGILLSMVICVLLLLMIKPDVFASATKTVELIRTPPQMENQRNDGLLMILLVNAVVGNAATGFFMAIIFPFSVMRNQKGNKEGENLGPGKPPRSSAAEKVDSLDQPIHSDGN